MNPLLLTLTFFSFGTIDHSVIYGEDNRAEVYQLKDTAFSDFAAWSDSTVALVKASKIEIRGDTAIFIDVKTHQETHGLCNTERFANEPVGAFCSGSLIGDDLVLTAGHCLKTFPCEQTRFVFGFAYKNESDEPTSRPLSEVYSCKEIIKLVSSDEGADFALVRLDRKVTGHKPLPLRKTGEPKISEELVSIGHPSGLPTKITAAGHIRKIEDELLVTTLDTYDGNSGAAVFNITTGEIEGVLTRGERDFVPNADGSCLVSKICKEEECLGEDVTRISVILPFLP